MSTTFTSGIQYKVPTVPVLCDVINNFDEWRALNPKRIFICAV